MSNPMKYIKNLEAAGFERIQAEAQVQMVLDALEGDLATKADFAVLKSDFKSEVAVIKSDFKSEVAVLKSDFKADVAVFKEQLDTRFIQVESRFAHFEGQMREMELRLITRLGFITVSITSIAVALLAWLIKL
jgi:hypothetical protein